MKLAKYLIYICLIAFNVISYSDSNTIENYSMCEVRLILNILQAHCLKSYRTGYFFKYAASFYEMLSEVFVHSLVRARNPSKFQKKTICLDAWINYGVMIQELQRACDTYILLEEYIYYDQYRYKNICTYLESMRSHIRTQCSKNVTDIPLIYKRVQLLVESIISQKSALKNIPSTRMWGSDLFTNICDKAIEYTYSSIIKYFLRFENLQNKYHQCGMLMYKVIGKFWQEIECMRGQMYLEEYTFLYNEFIKKYGVENALVIHISDDKSFQITHELLIDPSALPVL